MKLRLASALALLCLVGVPAADAAAPTPPQVLGLIATRQPAPLTCDEAACSGVFSTFCMQEKRPRPRVGQEYDLAGSGDLTVIVTRPDGTIDRFSATGLLAFTSEGAYTSIRITMPRSRMAALDASEVALLVPRHAALVPRTDDGDDAALRENDLEVATGPARIAAGNFFERPTPRNDAAVLMTRLINLLPMNDRAPAATRGDPWRRAFEGAGGRTLSPEGVSRARDVYERCRHYVEKGYLVRMRGCVARDHDLLLRSINQEYWESDTGY